ncbi:hypothetical protein PACTADRAFT_42339 [Pachysolen tannophilus NRRL Y-2460]|uniref:VPS9 domain-containing protein n=1 Tax=Pachysolen tannophilus NRRL Y-2460 TaxID=669874 RepID=A0A1E4TUJ0_PACTA|nr:hypothetical protein PACTADRAFT_42339 [Pachysolen tannophilus NRRL Y-2460]
MGKGKSPEVKEKNIEEIAESSSSLTAAAPSNNLGHLSQEAAPVFDFQKFLAQLKTKNCEPILRFLKSFLYQFQTKNIWTVDEQIKLIKDFEKFIYDKFVLIKQIDEDKNEYEADFAKEGFEKLIMSKLYLLVFPPAIPPKKLTTSHKEDLIQDLKLAENLVKFQWLEPRHLDLPESLMLSNSSFIKLSCIEINKLNNYKSPRDKIICVLNCCKVIFGLIRQSQHKNKVEENADSFIPLLIYVIIKAKPKNLISNINYIERFRNEKFLTGEISYYLSSLQIVSNFVINIERKLLTIDEEEFERHIIEYEEKSKKEKEKRQEEQEQKQKHDLDHDQETKSNQEQNSSNGIFAPFPQQLTSLMVGNKNSNRANEQSPSQLLANSAKETIDNLLAMFPEMARDIVRDIVIAKHCNIGDCVDVCLDLQA